MIAHFFGTLVDGLKSTLILAALGAGVGVGSLVIGRLITGLQGYGAAAILGAVVLVGSYGSAVFDGSRAHQKEAEIAQLKLDKAKSDQQVKIQTATNLQQNAITESVRKQIEVDQKQIDDLNLIIEKHKDDKSGACIFRDELNEIFRR